MPDITPSGTTHRDATRPDSASTDNSTPAMAAGQAAGAADKLRAALHARPGATSDDLAADAGIGRSTAAKCLARWVDDGTVARTPGIRQGNRTSASRFAITTPCPAPAATTPAHAAHGATHPHSATEPDAAGTNGTGDDAFTDHRSDTDTDRAGAVGDHDTASKIEPAGTGNPTGAPIAQYAASRSARLAAGALQGMVEDYLRDHPNDESGPTSIGHALRRSSGAISNALERLVASGDAVRTNDRPKRYRLAAVSADPAPRA